MIDALNFLSARAPMIAVPGNHEFDERRPGMLANAIKASRFPWLANNVRLNTGDAEADRRLGTDTVIESGGMRIGIFTLTFLDSPRDYATWDTAFVAIAERSIQALEAQGVDAIVGLTHLDLAVDQRIAALRSTHPKLIWIAGGIVIESAGSLLGAIGVSGAPGGDRDEACARAGMAAVRDALDF